MTGGIYNPGSPPANTQLLSVQNALYFPQFRAGLGRVRAKTGNAKIVMVGDSTTMGYGSNGSSTGNMKPLSVPTDIANMFSAQGIPATADSFYGDGTPTFSSSFDSRITIGSSWSHGSAFCGGDCFTAITNTNSLSFAPTDQVDTFVVWYWQYSGGGTLSVNINGGSPTTQSTNGSKSLQSLIVSTSLGSNTVNINWSSGANVYVQGVSSYNSAIPCIDVVNCGWYGSRVITWQSMLNNNFVSNPFALSQDLTTFCLGINDWNIGPTPLATFSADFQNLITLAKAVSDVALITPNPTQAGASLATQQTFINAMYALGSANNIPVIDNWARFVSYTLANANGMMYDTDHPNGVGYADLAQGVFNTIGANGL